MKELKEVLEFISSAASWALELIDTLQGNVEDLLEKGKRGSEMYLAAVSKIDHLQGYVEGLHTAYLCLLKLRLKKEDETND